ncbi:hypothetical protein PENSPDRAFT_651027 [Peniophora sp. CONT]|nr:hypothetical protein PENSPDRAFT_651027 [Peniophora sp. CONT]
MLSALKSTSSRALPLLSRGYATPSPAKLVKQLRDTIDGLAISKAREALEATNNDVTAALEWLSKDMALAGAKKAAKAAGAGRSTGQGLLGLSVLSRGAGVAQGRGGVRAALVELNCETDFVARNDLFNALLADLAHTAAFLAEPAVEGQHISRVDISAFEGAPLISARDPSATSTLAVGDAIKETIAKTGELIVLRRAAAVAHGPFNPGQSPIGLRVASYAHGGATSSVGRSATLALLALKSDKLPSLLSKESFLAELDRLERSLARQIVGFSADSIRAPEGQQDETALYSQPFGMLSGTPTALPVGEYLRSFSVEQGLGGEDEDCVNVVDMFRWQVGGPE